MTMKASTAQSHVNGRYRKHSNGSAAASLQLKKLSIVRPASRSPFYLFHEQRWHSSAQHLLRPSSSLPRLIRKRQRNGHATSALSTSAGLRRRIWWPWRHSDIQRLNLHSRPAPLTVVVIFSLSQAFRSATTPQHGDLLLRIRFLARTAAPSPVTYRSRWNSRSPMGSL